MTMNKIHLQSRSNSSYHLGAVIDVASKGNKYIDTEAPWKLAKKGDFDRLNTVLYVLVEVIRRLGILLDPVIPESSCNLLNQAGVPEDMR